MPPNHKQTHGTHTEAEVGQVSSELRLPGEEGSSSLPAACPGPPHRGAEPGPQSTQHGMDAPPGRAAPQHRPPAFLNARPRRFHPDAEEALERLQPLTWDTGGSVEQLREVRKEAPQQTQPGQALDKVARHRLRSPCPGTGGGGGMAQGAQEGTTRVCCRHGSLQADASLGSPLFSPRPSGLDTRFGGSLPPTDSRKG